MGVRKNCVAVNKKSPLWRPVALRVATVGPGEGGGTSKSQRTPLGRKHLLGSPRKPSEAVFVGRGGTAE